MSRLESQPPHGPPTPSDGPPSTPIPPLHRIRTVRQQQGISLRCAARRLHLSVEQVVQLEEGAADMPLTMLYRFQELFGVPIATTVSQTAGVGHVIAADTVWLDTDSQGVGVQWSETSNADDFSRNLIRARCEGRFGTSVLAPLGVVTATLTVEGS